MEHVCLLFLGLHMEALAEFLLHITNQHFLGSFSFLSGRDVVTVCFLPILDLAYCKSVTCCFTAKLLQLSQLWATSTSIQERYAAVLLLNKVFYQEQRFYKIICWFWCEQLAQDLLHPLSALKEEHRLQFRIMEGHFLWGALSFGICLRLFGGCGEGGVND